MIKQGQGKCVKTLFQREILCAGTMKNYVHVLQRDIQQTRYNDLQPTEKFTELWGVFSKMEVVSPTFRFDGVNINNTTTHACYIPYYAKIYELDRNTLFIKKQGTNSAKEKIYKLNSIENLGEQDEFMVLFLTERGMSENTAGQA